MRRTLKGIGLLVIVIVLSLAGGAFSVRFFETSNNQSSSLINTDGSSDANLDSSNKTTSIASLVSKTSPAVVSVTTTSTTYSFFGGPETEEGAGTGIIISSNGYIVTNNHVVPTGSQSLTVTTSSEKQYTATVVARDTSEDLALLKIKATDLTTLTLGNSSDIQVGDSVIAIGNALGEFQNTVTQGIISGTNRSITASDSGSDTVSSGESLKDLFQTDAAINPGNSGGPLIDVATGEVIGIDTATSGDGEDLGFAIPINEAKAFVAPYVKLD
jgi:serine protease Do